jgi:hypothetical protein
LFAAAKRSAVSIEDCRSRGSLGAGAFSTMALAHERDGHERGSEGEGNLAVKTLLRWMNIRYFEREKSIHGRLRHPLIVGLLDSKSISRQPRTDALKL